MSESNYTFREFQSAAEEFALHRADFKQDLAHWVAGLGEETGELLGAYKRLLRGDIDMEEFRKRVVHEAGDVLWYLSTILKDLDVPLEDAAKLNILRLSERKARGVLRGDGDTR